MRALQRLPKSVSSEWTPGTRLGTHQDRECDSTLLSSRERPDELKTRHSGDTEGSEVSSVLLVGLAREQLAEVRDAVHGEVERVDVVLSEVYNVRSGE